MGATIAAGTAHTSGAPEFIPVLSIAQSVVSM
jgi:hypothetical protein